LGEFTSGLLVALGFLGPVGPALMLAVMIVALMQHWRNGFFAMNKGVELPLLYASAAVALAFTGPGAYSMDAGVGLHSISTPTVDAIALAIAVVGALGTLALRRPAPAAG
jgi:putative oxidoreductase